MLTCHVEGGSARRSRSSWRRSARRAWSPCSRPTWRWTVQLALCRPLWCRAVCWGTCHMLLLIYRNESLGRRSAFRCETRPKKHTKLLWLTYNSMCDLMTGGRHAARHKAGAARGGGGRGLRRAGGAPHPGQRGRHRRHLGRSGSSRSRGAADGRPRSVRWVSHVEMYDRLKRKTWPAAPQPASAPRTRSRMRWKKRKLRSGGRQIMRLQVSRLWQSWPGGICRVF